MDDDHELPASIGWPRALLTAAVIVVVGVAVLVYGTNAVLTNIHGKPRSSLVGIVTPMFFVLLLALAWGLRQLQRRKII
jgi:hypothetical protein